MFNFSGEPPRELGEHGGQLRPCPDRPNCVCSQQVREQGIASDPHHIHPLTFEGSASAAWKRLQAVIAARDDATVRTLQGRYLHVEFRSRWMGFVDDLECLLDAEQSVIHLRSAARLGYSDFGVNRARLEDLREAFDDEAEAAADSDDGEERPQHQRGDEQGDAGQR